MSAYKSIDPERIRAFVKRQGITVRERRPCVTYDDVTAVLIDGDADADGIAKALGAPGNIVRATLSKMQRKRRIRVVKQGHKGRAGDRTVYAVEEEKKQ